MSNSGDPSEKTHSLETGGVIGLGGTGTHVHGVRLRERLEKV